MAVPEPVWGIVLAGGRSRRMGSDKASLKQKDGQTQLDRAMQLLSGHLEQVFVSTREDQADDPLRRAYPQIIDRYTDLGPVAGILSAMDRNADISWLVLACDLPNIDDITIKYLLDNASADHVATAFRSVHDGLPEPLCAIFRPPSRSVIDRFVAEGRYCPRKMLLNSPTHLLQQPSPGALHNINSPDDLADTGIVLNR